MAGEVRAMGFFEVFHAIREDRKLSSTEKWVLVLILSHVDRATGDGAIGAPKLTEESGFKVARTIERTVAKLLADGVWLSKADQLSRWGTNLYQVTPPGTRGVVVLSDRGSVSPPIVDRSPPDRGSVSPPIVDRSPPRSTIGHSGISSPGSSASTSGRGQSTPRSVRILSFLQAHEILEPISLPGIAELLSAERKTLGAIEKAIGSLAKDAAAGELVRDRWSPAVLAKKARSYVAGEKEMAGPEYVDDGPEAPPPSALFSAVDGLKTLSDGLARAGGSPPSGRRRRG